MNHALYNHEEEIMKRTVVIIDNPSGLHARPASLLVAQAQKYASQIIIEKGDASINGKSIIGILGLGVVKGDEIHLICEGEDEEVAIEGMKKVFETLEHE